MKILLIKFAIFFLNIIYFFLKLFKTKNKITMISRQSNNETLDFKLLREEIEKNKKYKVVVLCKKLEGKEKAKIISLVKYCFHMIKQMYHIATSKVVVLDSYCICISVLKHKKNLKVIQMWHSIGTMKKFGYDILDMEEGNSSKIAKVLKMHKNYDVILCAGEGYANDLARQFNYDNKYIKIIPLPRVDLLTDKNYIRETHKRIYEKYKYLSKKKNILYVPTFRKDEKELEKNVNKMITFVDFAKYNLIIKLHPLSNINIKNEKTIIDNDFSSMEMLTIADYVITDYSCILYEAAIMNKKIYFNPFDFDKYEVERSLNINYYDELPGFISKEIKDILVNIEKDKYDIKKLNSFTEKYVNYTSNSCKKIYSLIENLLTDNLKEEKNEEYS